MRARRLHAFTLVELLVSVMLATIIVGILAAVSIQAQRAIAVASLREDAARTAIAILGDVERDVGSLLPASAAPTPFPTTQKVLELERLAEPTGGPPTIGFRDRLRVLTMVRAPDGQADFVRGLVEWKLDPRDTDPADGPVTGQLTRRIVSWARSGDTSPTVTPVPVAPAPSGMVVGQNIVAFEIEWQDIVPPATGQFKAPDNSTKDGSIFVRDGTVNIDFDEPRGSLCTATAGQADLDAMPIGAELTLIQPSGPPLLMLIRRRPAAGQVLLHDRLPRNPNDLATGDYTGVPFTAFRGPPALRVTITVPFGRGPEAGTARFARTFPVPR